MNSSSGELTRIIYAWVIWINVRFSKANECSTVLKKEKQHDGKNSRVAGKGLYILLNVEQLKLCMDTYEPGRRMSKM